MIYYDMILRYKRFQPSNGCIEPLLEAVADLAHGGSANRSSADGTTELLGDVGCGDRTWHRFRWTPRI